MIEKNSSQELIRGKLLAFGSQTPRIHSQTIVFEGSCIIGDVSIEEDCSIWFGSILRADVNSIKIAKRSNIQDLTTIHLSKEDSVEIGQGVTIGHNCVIHACKIADFCLIGMGSIIMDKVQIGENSILGAGSLVTKGKIFPPNSLIMGNPAKYIRMITDEEIAAIKHSADEYVKLSKLYIGK